MAILLTFSPMNHAAEPGMADQALQTVEDVTVDLWLSIDDQRLKNRTPDQVVAWVIMGALVGAIAGLATSLKPTLMGHLGRLALGLAGAFMGGVAAQVGKFDFGWGPVLIRYEELACAFVGALILVGIGRLFRSKNRARPQKG